MRLRQAALIIVLILSFPILSRAKEDKVFTLSECYALALKQSEDIAINVEQIKETEARFLQSIGTLMPQVSFSSFDEKADGSSASSSRVVNSSERKFVFKQTLFSGFKEFAAMKGSKLEHSQRVNEKVRAEQLLFVDVSNAFYLLLEVEENHKVLEVIRDTLSGRIEELKTREQLGKSRHSEVVNAQVQLYKAEADIEQSKSSLKLAHQLLEFLAGKPVEKVSEADSAMPVMGGEEKYFNKAQGRADVLAAQDAWGVEKKSIDVARSGFYPTVSLETNLYAQRTTTPRDSGWDTTLNVDIPIFEGITTYGQVQEAFLKSYEKELEFKHLKRSAFQDIRDSYTKAQAAVSMTEALKKAQDSAQENFDLQAQDYKLNLVNNLDVLLAIQSLQDAKRNYIHSLYDSKRLYWQLLAAAGEIPQGK